MPPEYLKMYDTAKIKLPPNFMPQHNFDNGELKVRDELLAGFPRTIPEIKGHIRDYYAMITHLDAQIGRIIDALKESGEYENTIIIFSGDNGLALGQHGLMGKQNVYEHSVGVPLIWSGPGIPENQKRDAFVYLLDIYPTICEIIGIKVPDSVDGTSIKQCILDKNAQIRTSLYFSYRDFQRSVRDREYKLIEYNVSGKRTTQLFNIGADPWEKNNLADDPEYRNKLKSMRKAMLEQKKLTDDNGPFWEGIDFIKETDSLY
jgi:arylsulfatase A-like enzyme